MKVEKYTKSDPIKVDLGMKRKIISSKKIHKLLDIDFNAPVKISMNQNFTVGDIFRLKLLKNHSGEPYKDKATIARIVKNELKAERKLTPWGMGWNVHGSEITRWNNLWK
jgi:hypothetical protein